MLNVTFVELYFLKSYVSSSSYFLMFETKFWPWGETREGKKHLSLRPLDGSGNTWF